MGVSFSPFEHMKEVHAMGDGFMVTVWLRSGEKIGPFPALPSNDEWLWLDDTETEGALQIRMADISMFRLTVV